MRLRLQRRSVALEATTTEPDLSGPHSVSSDSLCHLPGISTKNSLVAEPWQPWLAFRPTCPYAPPLKVAGLGTVTTWAAATPSAAAKNSTEIQRAILSTHCFSGRFELGSCECSNNMVNTEALLLSQRRSIRNGRAPGFRNDVYPGTHPARAAARTPAANWFAGTKG